MWYVFAQDADDLLRSAQSEHSWGALLVQAVCVLVALMFFYGAYTTLKKGFKLTESKTLEGAPAKVVAGILALLGVGIIVFGIAFLPGLAF